MASEEDQGTVLSERSLRPFIIKAIQLIVQSRSGAKFVNPCLSNVGARNNMMIYLEDDPDIGATLKRALEPNYIIYAGDTIYLHIFLHLPGDPNLLFTVELWELSIKSNSVSGEPLLCGEAIAGNNLLKTKSGEISQNPHLKTRFFERLGSLLKSLLATSRLLPSHQFACQQRQKNFNSCYVVERVHSKLADRTVNEVILESPDKENQPIADGVLDSAKSIHVIRRLLGPDFATRVIGRLVTPNQQLQLLLRVFYRSVRSLQTANTETSFTIPVRPAASVPTDDPLHVVAPKGNHSTGPLFRKQQDSSKQARNYNSKMRPQCHRTRQPLGRHVSRDQHAGCHIAQLKRSVACGLVFDALLEEVENTEDYSKLYSQLRPLTLDLFYSQQHEADCKTTHHNVCNQLPDLNDEDENEGDDDYNEDGDDNDDDQEDEEDEREESKEHFLDGEHDDVHERCTSAFEGDSNLLDELEIYAMILREFDDFICDFYGERPCT